MTQANARPQVLKIDKRQGLMDQPPSGRAKWARKQDHASGFYVQNVVSTANLDSELDMQTLSDTCRQFGCKFKVFPTKAPAIIMNTNPSFTVIFVQNGNVVVAAGSVYEEEARSKATKLIRLLERLGFQVRVKDFKIQNIVGCCDVMFPIRLEALACALLSSYKPEWFPGLIYRMEHPKVDLLIFDSGKVVLTGAKETKDLNHAFENIYPVLEAFRKN